MNSISMIYIIFNISARVPGWTGWQVIYIHSDGYHKYSMIEGRNIQRHYMQ